ncbi:MAG: FeoC-like transcriptional regulator [Candidatus Malihini olakiniferum]
MTLIELRNFVKEKRRVSLQEVSQKFHVETGVVEGMMEIWIQKGKIHSHENASGDCSGCCSCEKGLQLYYDWVG